MKTESKVVKIVNKKDSDIRIGEKRKTENEGKERKKVKKDKKLKKSDLEEEIRENVIDKSTEEDGINNEDGEKNIKKKKPSKRQLKREKAELRAAQVKEESKLEMAQKVFNYLSKWKYAKSEWKFEKVKQIWLIKNLLNDKYVPDNQFSIVLEYFAECKGLARKSLIETAMAVIRKVEANIENDKEENDEVVETTEYKRARQLLQTLPNET